MAGLTATQVHGSRFFTLDYFNSQVPWYGPYIRNGQHYTIASSACLHWRPAVDFSLTGFIFDEAGNVVGEKLLLERRQADRPVTVELQEAFKDLPPVKGMVALLLRPADPNIDMPTSPQTWCIRIFNRSGISEIIASGSSKSINFSEKSGHSSKFRLFSASLTINGGWKPIACVLNPSINPAYSTTVNLQVAVFNGIGERLEASGGSVPPFGTAWLDISELFGDSLRRLLSSSDGRGSYMIRSDDAGCIGYHFLYHPETAKLAGDHTRPLSQYIPRCYGARAYTIRKPGLRAFLGHAKFLSSRLLRP